MVRSQVRRHAAVSVTMVLAASGMAFGAWPPPYLNAYQAGLIDAEHTLPDGSHSSSFGLMNSSGRVTGDSLRYNNDPGAIGTDASVSAWTWTFGSGTVRVGLIDAEHTSSDDRKASFANGLSAGDVVTGTSLRYSGTTYNGASAWAWTPSLGTVNIGLVDGAHTGTGAYRNSFAQRTSASGQVYGYSDVFDAGGSNAGTTPWAWTSGVGNTILGLNDAEHTRADGIRSGNFSGDTANDSGRAIGYSQRYSGVTLAGQSAWTWSAGSGTTRLGVVDADHTAGDGSKVSIPQGINAAGRVTGYSDRYVGTQTGSTAWTWTESGGQTRIGLVDGPHTSSSGVQFSRASGFMNGDRVLGTSTRYSGDSSNGQSAWAWTASTTSTQRIGLFDSEHTQVGSGYQESSPTGLSSSAVALGISNRYDAAGASTGISAWAWNPGTGVSSRIGLIDAGHTGAGGTQFNAPITSNTAGRVVGTATHFSSGNSAGESVWTWSPASGTTTRLGIFSAGQPYTASNGTQQSVFVGMNDLGDIVGISTRYQNASSTVRGHAAWFFDHSTETTTPLLFSFGAINRAEIRPMVLTDGGILMGTYDNAFLWSTQNGLTDLGALVNGGLSGQSIASLQSILGASGLDYIATHGRALGELNSSQNVFIFAVPAPGCASLLVCAGLLAARRRRAR
jgi:hypothetical protein